MLTSTLNKLVTKLMTVSLICLIITAVEGSSPDWAQSNQPDVQAIIMHGPGGTDLVDLTYPKVIPASQAAHDVAALAQDAGLGSVQVDVTNHAEKLPKLKTTPMTSATFTVSGILPDDNHETAFRLAPWVMAFKGYRTVTITYLMNQEFGFDGLRQYRDNNVDIELDRRGDAYTYRVAIIDPHFDHINLPFLQPDSHSTVTAVPPSRKPWIVAGFIAVSAIAAGLGYGVWALLSKIV